MSDETNTPIEDSDESTGVRSITVSGLTFEVADKYDEGHVITANEAGALNQTRAENLRNNFAAKIRKAVDDAKVKSADELPDETIAALTADFKKYADEYEFGQRTTRSGETKAPVDPVEREASKIAKDMVRKALTEKGIKVKALPEGKFDQLVANLLSKNPAIRENARTIVAQRQSLAAGALNLDV